MIKILFVSSDPKDATRIHLGKELRECRKALKQGKFGNCFLIEESPATRASDFIQAMIDISPDIVHFLGHGNKNGELLLEDDAGNVSPAPASDLAKMFKQFKDTTSLVLLNACHSRTQADAIAKYVHRVIATKTAIGDEAAINFSAGFYQGLASGRDVAAAFELGCARMGMGSQSSRSKLMESVSDIMLLKKGSGRARLDLNLKCSESDGQAAVPRPSSRDSATRTPIADQDRENTTTVRADKTTPTGRCFICYKRERLAEVVTLVAALHDHGIPTWQDVSNLDYFHTEQRIVEVLSDPGTASAVLWISPEVQQSKMIEQVEVPAILKRAKAQDGFAFLPVLAGGLRFSDVASVLSSRHTRETLSDWNLRKVNVDPLTDQEAADIARAMLDLRICEIHKALPKDAPLRIEAYTRPPAIVNDGVALTMDWTGRFDNREAKPQAWDAFVLPSVSSIVHTVVSRAPGRSLELSGNLVIAAATALGTGFLARRGVNATWKQLNPDQTHQYWNLGAKREASGFKHALERRTVSGQDLAVLVSVSRDVEPAFFNTEDLPAFRAILRVTKAAKAIHSLETAGQAIDVARIVVEGIEEARSVLPLATVHLFMAVPVGLAFLMGQLLNVLGPVQTYELASADAIGHYRRAALLRPSQ